MTVPGDELVPDANLVLDRRYAIAATPEEIWPWLAQLGKRRAGWYLPRRVERLLPRPRRAARSIHAEFQRLRAGERIPDYGGRDAWFEVAQIDPPRTLVYRSERHGTEFSWALLLSPGERATELRLRFRGRLRSRGARRAVLAALGDLFDRATVELMVAGLRERVAEAGGRPAGPPPARPG